MMSMTNVDVLTRLFIYSFTDLCFALIKKKPIQITIISLAQRERPCGTNTRFISADIATLNMVTPAFLSVDQ